MTKTAQLTVTEKSNKKRLDVFLSEQTDISRAKAQGLIKQGLVTINDNVVNKASKKINENDRISVSPQIIDVKENTKKSKPAKIVGKVFNIKDIKIIAETDDYLVVDKPCGLLVHPTNMQESNTLSSLLLKKYPQLKKVGESEERPGIVHRLDKEASGVMVVAKTQPMFLHLKKQFQNRVVEKEYTVLVHELVLSDNDTIDFPIARSKNDGKMAALPIPQSIKDNNPKLKDYRKIDAISKQFSQSREARTELWIKEKFINYTLLDVKIHTGRTHQIRVHMLAYNHPVAGDNLYCNKKSKLANKNISRLFLHSSTLGFKDINDKQVKFESQLPPELKQILKTIK